MHALEQTPAAPSMVERLKAVARVSLLTAGILLAPGHEAEAAPAQKPVAKQPAMPQWALKLGVTPQEIVQASRTLDRALASPLARGKIPDLQGQRDLLLAQMARESALQVDAVSSSGARGYFQMMPIALRQVEQVYDLPRGSLAAPDVERDTAAGLLYMQWTFDRVQRLFPDEKDPRGLMKLALIGHNAGPALLTELRRPGDTYETFVQRTARQLHHTVGGEQETALREVHPNYGVRYRALPGIKRYQDLRRKGAVGGRVQGTSVALLGDGLEYAEVIAGISTELRSAAPAWQRGGTSVEVVSPKRGLWSISNDVTSQLAGHVRGFNTRDLRGNYQARAAWRDRVQQIILSHNGLREVDLEPGTRIEIPPMRTFQLLLEKKPRVDRPLVDRRG